MSCRFLLLVQIHLKTVQQQLSPTSLSSLDTWITFVSPPVHWTRVARETDSYVLHYYSMQRSPAINNGAPQYDFIGDVLLNCMMAPSLTQIMVTSNGFCAISSLFSRLFRVTCFAYTLTHAVHVSPP